MFVYVVAVSSLSNVTLSGCCCAKTGSFCFLGDPIASSISSSFDFSANNSDLSDFSVEYPDECDELADGELVGDAVVFDGDVGSCLLLSSSSVCFISTPAVFGTSPPTFSSDFDCCLYLARRFLNQTCYNVIYPILILHSVQT